MANSIVKTAPIYTIHTHIQYEMMRGARVNAACHHLLDITSFDCYECKLSSKVRKVLLLSIGLVDAQPNVGVQFCEEYTV